MPQTITATTVEEIVQIKRTFNKLLRAMRNSLKDQDKDNLMNAFELALDSHKYQRRKSGEPYIYHPIEVARICYEEIGLGPTAVICALIHDVVEDTPISLDQIKKLFGEKIANIVDGLTKLDGLYNVENAQAENFKKVLSTLTQDVRVVLIKMADRLHNLRTIDSMPQHKQLKIAAETTYIYTPLAHRLGLYQIKMEFNDICLKISEPETYKEISSKLQTSKAERNAYIREFIKPLKKELNQLGLTYRVLGRPKAISSIYNKIKSKKVAFEEIYDLFAVRIIIDVPQEKEKSTCWQIYSIITDVYKPIPERLKDWITTPKGNGYESLHTTVIGPKGRYVEVQIRTERMDEIAERGFAAHWKYKGIKTEQSVYDSWLDGIRGILDEQHTDALEFLNDFKTNLFSEEVYVFTPNGDMRILPKGATALDFAFDIHTDVGYHTTAIKVNNKLVPMGYKLSNGDQLSVTTNKNQKPSEEWLKMVVTGKARAKIRAGMKEEMRKAGEYGKETLQRKLKNAKLGFEDNIDFLVKHFKLKSRPDLYYGIANETIKLDLKQFGLENGKLITKKSAVEGEQAPAEELKEKKEVTAVPGKSNIMVNGEPAEIYDFSFATCCNPVQGDSIFAYLTTNKGLKIHRSSCPNATHLLANYGYRILKAEWAGTTPGKFIVELQIIGVDTGVGVIQMLSQEISEKLGLNIRSFNIEGMEGVFNGKINLYVTNLDQLKLLIRSIEKLPGISNVIRVDKAFK
jgi:GTP diphosphokinase / guanosine-3',5'-bis(diphosphate) 3'-diphosphatase